MNRTLCLLAALLLLPASATVSHARKAPRATETDVPATNQVMVLPEGGHPFLLSPSPEEPDPCPQDKESGRVFPEWKPPPPPPAANDWRTELAALLAQGRRDRAASPAFLDALQQLLDRHAADPAPLSPPSDRLPFHPAFDGPGMPPGWSAVKPEVWRFGDGFATQVRSWADTRFVLSYDPGREWRDYSATFTVESDSWFTHPMRSSAVLYFRYRGVTDSFSLWLDSAGDLTLASQEARGSRILARIPVESAVIRDGKPWTVTVRGDEIKVFHEGRCLLMASDPAHPRGTIGLEAVHIPARFSALSVTAPAR
jgi:hypothetical protein